MLHQNPSRSCRLIHSSVPTSLEEEVVAALKGIRVANLPRDLNGELHASVVRQFAAGGSERVADLEAEASSHEASHRGRLMACGTAEGDSRSDPQASGGHQEGKGLGRAPALEHAREELWELVWRGVHQGDEVVEQREGGVQPLLEEALLLNEHNARQTPPHRGGKRAKS